MYKNRPITPLAAMRPHISDTFFFGRRRRDSPATLASSSLGSVWAPARGFACWRNTAPLFESHGSSASSTCLQNEIAKAINFANTGTMSRSLNRKHGFLSYVNLDKVDFNELGIRYKFEEELQRFNKFQRSVLGFSGAKTKHEEVDQRTYAKYILKEGTGAEKRELMGCFKSRIKITKGSVTIEP